MAPIPYLEKKIQPTMLYTNRTAVVRSRNLSDSIHLFIVCNLAASVHVDPPHPRIRSKVSRSNHTSLSSHISPLTLTTAVQLGPCGGAAPAQPGVSPSGQQIQPRYLSSLSLSISSRQLPWLHQKKHRPSLGDLVQTTASLGRDSLYFGMEPVRWHKESRRLSRLAIRMDLIKADGWVLGMLDARV